MQLFVRLSEDLAPLVFEIPTELVAHLDLLKQLGAGETATVSRLVELLQVSKYGCMHQLLCSRPKHSCCIASMQHKPSAPDQCKPAFIAATAPQHETCTVYTARLSRTRVHAIRARHAARRCFMSTCSAFETA